MVMYMKFKDQILQK